MTTKITIKNLRHIAMLEFEIPKRGVWLLTGANGTGKTSLLGCLRRIGYKNAFPVHFPASRKSTQLDSNENASIAYETRRGNVVYTYGTTRWVPTPKAGGAILAEIGYPDVLYVAANADRIEPQKEDFSPKRVKAASVSIIAAANLIFSTNKFDNLKIINIRTGVGSQAFLIELASAGKQKRYFSEKNLSLGELCILKLLRMLMSCKNGSLVLIDELELALHPTAQAELLEYLRSIAEEKSLTVIVSTHSSTIIKSAGRKNIMFLQSDDQGNVTCSKGCFPSYVLGMLAYREENASDVIIYVEDECAKAVTEKLIDLCKAERFPHDAFAPTVGVIPVGGINEVLRFFVLQRPLLPAVTRPYIMLDGDAEESLENARVPDIVQIYADEGDKISFLPWTPEIGFLKFLHAERVDILAKLRRHFNHNISFRAADVPALPVNGNGKTEFAQVCARISGQVPGRPKDVDLVLMRLLAVYTYEENGAQMKQMFLPILVG
jgi:ABC-type lipoprotein export system ATPase subunit